MTDLVVCSDRQGLPALHTCLLTATECTPDLRIHLLSEDIGDHDLALLQQTVGNTPIETYQVDPAPLAGFKRMAGTSIAPYFRLLAPATVNSARFIYLDTDTLVGTNLAEIAKTDLASRPAGMVPEAPALSCADACFLATPSTSSHTHYFNSGVMLIDSTAWKSGEITRRCLEYISTQKSRFHDQTAINVVLGNNCSLLPERFNTIANQRKHWPLSLQGNILHLVDRPKPWDVFGRSFHPQAHLWWPAFRRTALAGELPLPAAKTGGFTGYKKAFKDYLLTTALRRGFVSRVKGMP